MSLFRCAFLLLALSSCFDNSGQKPDAAPGESTCGPVEPEECKVCNPECPAAWPDACNPPAACLDDLYEGRCCYCDEDDQSWVLVYVESFCPDLDAG
jgi:hypothetical protein